jgi:hypothetical protein
LKINDFLASFREKGWIVDLAAQKESAVFLCRDAADGCTSAALESWAMA